MSEQPNSSGPFQPLGQHLKYLREQLSESLAEVSGAVEIDTVLLERIESGLVRPAEDVLLLLINHFDMQDHEALRLWELAGYDGDVPEQLRPLGEPDAQTKTIIMMLTHDIRTLYSDGVEITPTNAGITLTFTQTTTTQAAPISRIGMSYEQARQLLQTLQQAMLKGTYLKGPKALPPRTKK